MSKAINLRVLFTQFASWPKGFVLSTDDLPPGADLQRLLDLKAVEVVEDTRTGEPPLGPDTFEVVKNPEAEPAHKEVIPEAPKSEPAKRTAGK